MSRFKVELSPRARRQLSQIERWWFDNHPSNPDLLVMELQAIGEMIADNPGAGAVYNRRVGVRRVLMPRSQYYLYYRIVEARGLISIVAFWHTARGRGPRV